MTKEQSPAKTNIRHFDRSYYQIQSVTKALDLLEVVATSPDGVDFSNLMKQLGITREATLKLVTTLVLRGYLETDRLTERYHLSLQTLYLSQSFIRHSALLPQAKPIIEALNRACEETVYISVLKDKQSVYLEQAETRHAVRVVSRFGSQLPAYCSAGGKVLLAGLGDNDLAAYLDAVELYSYTPTTMTDRSTLEAYLRQVASQGYAVNVEELESGVYGIAAPVRNHAGQVVAAVVISAPTVRVTPKRLEEELIPLVREAADSVSLRLGFHLHTGEEE